MTLDPSIMMPRHAARVELPFAWPHRVLIQWDRESLDGGVPVDVGMALLGAMKAIGAVVHPVDTRALPAGSGLVPKDWNLFDAFQTRKWALAGDDPAAIFATPFFPWSMGGTGLLIDPVPNLESVDIDRVLRSDLEALLPDRARCVVLPGVDGDMAGIYAADRASLDRFTAALSRAAEAHGLALDVEV